MSTTTLLSRAAVAADIGCHPNTVTRFARAHGIGLRGVYTPEDHARLKSLIGPRGNPQMLAGGKFAAALQEKAVASRRNSKPPKALRKRKKGGK